MKTGAEPAARIEREQFEEEVTRHMKGLFRLFEAYMRDKYGLRTADQRIAENAQQLTERFNKAEREQVTR
jgi:hypothetical protein